MRSTFSIDESSPRTSRNAPRWSFPCENLEAERRDADANRRSADLACSTEPGIDNPTVCKLPLPEPSLVRQLAQCPGGQAIHGIYRDHVSAMLRCCGSEAGRSTGAVQHPPAAQIGLREREHGFVFPRRAGADQVLPHVVGVWNRNHSASPLLGRQVGQDCTTPLSDLAQPGRHGRTPGPVRLLHSNASGTSDGTSSPTSGAGTTERSIGARR
jgi:hypothetical protein